MAVVSARLIASREYGDDDKGTRKAQKIYLVRCDDKNDTPDVAAAACPAINTAYNVTSPGLKVTSRDAKERERTGDGGTLYEVTLDYTTQTADPEQSDPNPLNRARIVKITFDSTEETTYVAPSHPDAVQNDAQIPQKWLWGKAVCNSAGQPFDPSIIDIYRDPIVTIQQNMARLPWDFMKRYRKAVNRDRFSIGYRANVYDLLPGQAWMYDLGSEPKYENGIPYEEVTVVLKIREEGWKRKILDQGTEELNNGDIPPRPILDSNGDPVRKPVLLDGSGSALKSFNKNPTPVFLRWQFKDELNFAGLPFWS